VFAHSDNGDLCGWHPGTLAGREDYVVRLVGFDELPLAGSTRQFLDGLLSADYFGVGVLDVVYRLHDWLA
jgi:hypothetical protein